MSPDIGQRVKISVQRRRDAHAGMSRRILGLAIGLALTLTAPADALTIAGLSDQHADGIGDPRVRSELSMTAGRLVVRWDVATADPAKVDGWLAAARSRRIRPLVVFNRTPETRCPSAPCVLPSVAQFRAAFRAFRKRWPSVREFAPWNEANVRSQPLHDNPRRAARFYNAMVAECPKCTVLGAELLDNTRAAAYVRKMTPLMRVKAEGLGRPQLRGHQPFPHARHRRDPEGHQGQDLADRGRRPGALRRRGPATTSIPTTRRSLRARRAICSTTSRHIRTGSPACTTTRGATGRPTTTGSTPRCCAATAASDPATTSSRRGWRSSCRASRVPRRAPRRPRADGLPFELLDRRLRLTRRGVLAGPLRCSSTNRAPCSGRLELRWNGHRTPFASRRFELRAGSPRARTIRLGPRMRRTLARRRSSGKVTLVVRLARPRALTRAYPRLRIVQPR